MYADPAIGRRHPAKRSVFSVLLGRCAGSQTLLLDPVTDVTDPSLYAVRDVSGHPERAFRLSGNLFRGGTRPTPLLRKRGRGTLSEPVSCCDCLRRVATQGLLNGL